MNDDELDSLDPRQFEELVASIFSSEGYDINIISATGDGGVDVFAERINNLELPDQWIIECKNYKKDRPIGVEIVRQPRRLSILPINKITLTWRELTTTS